MMRTLRTSAALGLACGLTACGASEENLSTFSLRFEATANGTPVSCTSTMTGLGEDGTASVGPSDLRFYVSNVRFYDAAGNELPVELDEDAFQYQGEHGQVSLVDLTGTSEGTCTGSGIAFAEGTSRTHPAITGRTRTADVARVAFDVGVPQLLMKEVIGATTPEEAPSPLDEMYWSWASGYRHFVFNFTVTTADGDGEGYLHIGSTDCGPADGNALTDRDSCTYVNTPTVSLDSFDLANDTVGVDLAALLAGLDFQAPLYDPETYEVIGTGPGVECHSSPDQADCSTIFGNAGIDIRTGTASSTSNAVFVRQ